MRAGVTGMGAMCARDNPVGSRVCNDQSGELEICHGPGTSSGVRDAIR